MKFSKRTLTGCALAGLAAGCVNGIFGAAGGMVLIPAVRLTAGLPDRELFPFSVCVMLPICAMSLLLSVPLADLPFSDAAPYLLGGALGGAAAGLWGKRIPGIWLHRIFGVLILWGGIRYLC